MYPHSRIVIPLARIHLPVVGNHAATIGSSNSANNNRHKPGQPSIWINAHHWVIGHPCVGRSKLISRVNRVPAAQGRVVMTSMEVR